MKIYFSIVIFILLCTSGIYAQEYYNLYKDYIPKGHEKTISTDMINLQIKTDGELNPSIIYHRIVYNNNIINKNTTDPNASGYNHVRRLTYESAGKKDNWIEQCINILDSNYSSDYNYRSVSSIFKKNLTGIAYREVNTVSTNEYKENLDYYFRYIYYTRDTSVKFNESINFKNKVNDVEEKIVNHLLLKFKEIKTLSEEDMLSLINNIIGYWYLFNEQQIKKEDVVSALIASYKVINSVINENHFFIHGGVNYSIYSNQYKLSYSDFPKLSSSFLRKWVYDIAKVNYSKNENLILGYKIFLREGNVHFAYLKSEAILTHAKMYYTLIDTVTARSFNFYTMLVDDMNFQREFYTVYQPKFKVGEKYGLMLQLTTPLFFITKDIVFEVGLIGGYERAKYSYELAYDHYSFLVRIPYSNYQTIKKGEKIEEIKYFNIYYASFVLNFNFTLFNYIYSEIFVHYNTAGINAGISF